VHTRESTRNWSDDLWPDKEYKRPGGDKMGEEIMKVMWEWTPGRTTAVQQAWIPPREVEDSTTCGLPHTREAGLHRGPIP